jgi:hypothetical protein
MAIFILFLIYGFLLNNPKITISARFVGEYPTLIRQDVSSPYKSSMSSAPPKKLQLLKLLPGLCLVNVLKRGLEPLVKLASYAY